jgi:hypothetical protein
MRLLSLLMLLAFVPFSCAETFDIPTLDLNEDTIPRLTSTKVPLVTATMSPPLTSTRVPRKAIGVAARTATWGDDPKAHGRQQRLFSNPKQLFMRLFCPAPASGFLRCSTVC